ncbi:MAG TPA: PLD nuclease N-terminal domain-containing protein [Candidatus Paceibacterota bacterium]|nr:PLD nuclease N-terminal domain-containing protein [Verrucomicrobiota bacterium]HSA09886.1 PLD nuclease N-terminal domain-containing protein [Candidatus Paceibacterota bacterium]
MSNVDAYYRIAFFLVGGLFFLACFVFWVWMLIHAIKNKGLSDTEKIVWVLVILFVHVIGALIYFFVGRPKASG